MSHQESIPLAIPVEELKAMAVEVAGELRTAGPARALPPSGGGSFHRALRPDLRDRFIELRASLFQRGIFDPLLARFDSATVPLATTAEIADELAKVAASLN